MSSMRGLNGEPADIESLKPESLKGKVTLKEHQLQGAENVVSLKRARKQRENHDSAHDRLSEAS